MPKAYWVAHVDVEDAEIYGRYREANAVAFEKYGARFLIRGAPQQLMEGDCRARTVVIEFDSFDIAKACHDSPEYAAAAKIRDEAADVSLVIVEGYDG